MIFRAASSAVGSGNVGGRWMFTSGVGNGEGVMFGGSLRRLSALGETIGVGSSPVGTSFHRQNRVSSFCSQLLQSPITASANTPLVGRLIRVGGNNVRG